MIVLMVALGAAFGAPARYLIDREVQSRHSSVIPWGTFTVNVAACLVLGLVTGAAADARVAALIGTGFCGALSTYSTFSFETMRLGERGERARAAIYLASSLVAGFAAAAVGWWLASSL